MPFCNAILGRFPGGLAQVNVLQSIVFASGGTMAVGQAVGAFELFTGLAADAPRMESHLRRLLAGVGRCASLAQACLRMLGLQQAELAAGGQRLQRKRQVRWARTRQRQ